MFLFEVEFLTRTLQMLLLMMLGGGSDPFSQPYIPRACVCIFLSPQVREDCQQVWDLASTVTGKVSLLLVLLWVIGERTYRQRIL